MRFSAIGEREFRRTLYTVPTGRVRAIQKRAFEIHPSTRRNRAYIANRSPARHRPGSHLDECARTFSKRGNPGGRGEQISVEVVERCASAVHELQDKYCSGHRVPRLRRWPASFGSGCRISRNCTAIQPTVIQIFHSRHEMRVASTVLKTPHRLRRRDHCDLGRPESKRAALAGGSSRRSKHLEDFEPTLDRRFSPVKGHVMSKKSGVC